MSGGFFTNCFTDRFVLFYGHKKHPATSCDGVFLYFCGMKERYRLVAYIFPETNWVGDRLDESAFPVIATEDQSGEKNYGIAIQEVWHPRDDPNGWMVYQSNFYVPDYTTIEGWKEFKEKVDHALSLPVMHRKDFTQIFET